VLVIRVSVCGRGEWRFARLVDINIYILKRQPVVYPYLFIFYFTSAFTFTSVFRRSCQ